MQVILAKTAGFCYGVERAVRMAEAAAREGGCVMLGSIIHNDRVITALEALGARQADSPQQVRPRETVIIRAHGETREALRVLEERGAQIMDATCPHVLRIHRLVERAARAGRTPIIIGEAHHPEVMAAASRCERSVVLENTAELADWVAADPARKDMDLLVTAQTTCIRSIWEECVKFLKKQCTNAEIFDTICDATQKRQSEAANIAGRADVMVVVGDRKSANTRHLAEICSTRCARVYQIEGPEELRVGSLNGCSVAGLTAGASTPAGIIKEVYATMSEEIKNMEATEESFEEMLEKSFKTLNTGEKVTGIVTAIGPTEVQVDLGCKQAGYISVDELSADPNVKPEDVVKVGDEIEVSEPAGGFVLDDRETPVVMIAEGIGITPMVAMLSEIATDHPLRRVHLIYSTKNGEHFPLQEETKNLIKLIPDSGMAVGYTEPRFDEHVGQDYQFTGKLMPATLRHACMDAESDVYLCGSEIFVEYVRNIILQYRTIPADHIHTQVFVRTR